MELPIIKIVVLFKPATGGGGSFNYLAYLDGSDQASATISDVDVVVDSDNYVHMIVENLQYDKTYTVVVKAFDVTKQKYTDTSKYVQVRTLNAFVPDFDGVSSLENAAGVDAMTKVKLNWSQAKNPDVTSGDEFDPIHIVSGYNIYHSTSRSELEAILAEENQEYIDISKYRNSKIIRLTNAGLTTYTVSNLVSNTTYYFAMRARQSSSPPKYELNEKVLSIATLKNASVDFGGVTSTTLPVGILGFSQINVGWNVCIGCSEYRIYAKPIALDNGSIHPFYDSSYLISTISNASTSSSTISNATKIVAENTYRIYVLACKNSCGVQADNTINENEVKGRTTSKVITMIPTVSKFTEANSANMITSVEQPSGEAGLTSLDITWSEIDKSLGYYTKVNIYRVLNKNGAVNDLSSANLVLLNRSFNATDPYVDPAVTPALTYANEPTTARITNLDMGTEYCFLVIPVISQPDLTSDTVALDGDYWPTLKCGTPQYKAPVFNISQFVTGCSTTSTTATINWIVPDQENVMTHYEIFYKLDDGDSFSFTGANGAWQNGAGTYISPPGTGKVTKENLSTTIEGLIPKTSYTFGVNAYYKHPDIVDPYRTVPSVSLATVTCETTVPDVDHQGWKTIFSTGPKVDGRDSSVLPEKLYDVSKIPIDSLSDRFAGIVYPASSTGITRLEFYDYSLGDSNYNMEDFDDPALSGFGYTVYRLEKTSFNSEDDILDSSNVIWSLEGIKLRTKTYGVSGSEVNIASSTIQSDTDNSFIIPLSNLRSDGYGNKYIEFFDYSGTAGKVYYYKFVAVFNGVEAEFSDPDLSGNIVKIAKPLSNMGLLHRWMANKDTCDELYRGFKNGCSDSDPSKCSDPYNDYRCVYDGFGYTTINTDKYFDYGKTLVWDRFELGCNYTKLNCGGADCKGSVDPLATSLAVDNTGIDTVYWRKTNSTCWIRPAGAGSSWKLTRNYTAAEMGYHTPGSGYGRTSASNSAYLGLYLDAPIEHLYGLCNSRTQIDWLQDGNNQTYRLPRLMEATQAMRWPTQYIDVRFSPYNTLASHTAEKNFMSYAGGETRGCNMAVWTTYDNTTMKGDEQNANYTASGFYPHAEASTRVLISGTSGVHSTEECVSRFGLQDMIGNANEYTSDIMNLGLSIDSVLDPDNHAKSWFNIVGANQTDVFQANLGTPAYVSPVTGLVMRCTSGCVNDDKIKTLASIYNYRGLFYADPAVSNYYFTYGGYWARVLYEGGVYGRWLKRYENISYQDAGRCVVEVP